jgi:hypothetical protein
VTASELLERGRAAAAWKWTPVILVALLAALLVQRLDAGRRASGEAARLAEAEVLRQRGLAVAAQTDAAGARSALRDAVAQVEGLAAEVKRLQAAAPGARPVIVIRSTTGPAEVGGAPRAADPAGVVPACAPCRACVLAAGDRGELRLAQAGFQTKGGNLVFVGAGEAWRVWPEPATRLFSGPLTAETTIERPEGAPGWGFGGIAWAGQGGWAAGPAAAFPPVRLWRLELDATVGAGIGPTGTWGVGGTAVGRWR